MADTFTFEIPQSLIDRAVRETLEKYAPQIEDILKSHIESDIEGVTAGNGGPWYPDGSPYVKRNVLAGGVTHKISGSTLRVSSTAGSAPSVIHGGVMGGWGGYLEFHEVGNWGFMRHIGFPRPAVTNAQKEADALKPQMEEEAINRLLAML